jgi:8-oxo-dGTP pyrophosphatase MutT (NUDIX family)
MENTHLIWQEKTRKDLYKTRVFTVQESVCQSPRGETGIFSLIDAKDWAIVVPLLETGDGEKFVMVRQWRHGSQELSLEFPGGVFESGENGGQAAARELEEETAYRPGNIRKLGEMSPNPAIMTNRIHFYLARDLEHMGKQRLDADEYVDVALVSPKEALRDMGQSPYRHALMAAAMAFYLRENPL